MSRGSLRSSAWVCPGSTIRGSPGSSLRPKIAPIGLGSSDGPRCSRGMWSWNQPIFPRGQPRQGRASAGWQSTARGQQKRGVSWSLSGGSDAAGEISLGSVSATGLYTAPAGPLATTLVKVIATSIGYPNETSSATVTVAPCIAQVAPANVTVVAGATQFFKASTCGGAISPNRQWTVNGTVGGSLISGTISTDGIYTAPRIPRTKNGSCPSHRRDHGGVWQTIDSRRARRLGYSFGHSRGLRGLRQERHGTEYQEQQIGDCSIPVHCRTPSPAH